MATRALIHLPRSVKRGEVFEIRTTLSHPMETGYRRDADGRMLPRDIVHRLEVRYAGQLVFAADLHRAIAANPFIAFSLVARDSGPIDFLWSGDHGFTHRERVMLETT